VAGWSTDPFRKSEIAKGRLILMLFRGGVSRIKDEDKFFECWIKDGRWPTAYAVQSGYANRS